MPEKDRSAGRNIVDTVLAGVGRRGALRIDAKATAEEATVEDVTGQQGDEGEKQQQGGIHGRHSLQIEGSQETYDLAESTVK